jgi:5-methylcytosine-specific restriction endonuclease McrA
MLLTLEQKRQRAEYAVKRRRENPEARKKHVEASCASAKKRRADDPAFVAAQKAYQAEYHKRRSADPAYLARRRLSAKKFHASLTEEDKVLVRAADRSREMDPRRHAAKRSYMRERHKRADVKLRHKLTAQRRRARLHDSCSPGVTPAEWLRICDEFRNEGGEVVCAYCRKACAATIDHVIPIARGGRDEPTNVVPCCRFCNTSKGARLLSEWHRTPAEFRSQCPQNTNQTLLAG